MPRKDARCQTEHPEWREVEPDRWVACHYAEQPIPPPRGNP